ncbi:hypothetical protein [Bosea sp. NBC_00550]|uniref:hypothetical protein n=1 Tax=Bosea sp. NBC_00550 TaxID=2969621 RepID=UPI00222EE67F|nr:hypothetical protein [Bosea sp. NBC_00550]UZF95778.1 hypothetical protein NWE53_27725 [Bosea sp. NBC_00550]
MDVIIRKGTVVSTAGLAKVDIGIADGKIVHIGSSFLEAARHNAMDYSSYEGHSVKGLPRTVLLRGKTVVESRDYVGEPGEGRFLKRASYPAAPLSVSTGCEGWQNPPRRRSCSTRSSRICRPRCAGANGWGGSRL